MVITAIINKKILFVIAQAVIGMANKDLLVFSLLHKIKKATKHAKSIGPRINVGPWELKTSGFSGPRIMMLYQSA